MIPLKLHREVGDIEYVVEAEVDEEHAERGEAVVVRNVLELAWFHAGYEEYLDKTGKVIYHENEVIPLQADEIVYVNMKLGVEENDAGL